MSKGNNCSLPKVTISLQSQITFHWHWSCWRQDYDCEQAMRVGLFLGLHCLSHSPATPDVNRDLLNISGKTSMTCWFRLNHTLMRYVGAICFSLSLRRAIWTGKKRAKNKHLCLVLVTTITLLRGTKLSFIFLTQNYVLSFAHKDEQLNLVSQIQIIAAPVIDKERSDMRLGLGSQNGSNCWEVLPKLTNSL